MSNSHLTDLIALLTPAQGGFFVQDIPNAGGRPRNLILVPDLDGLVREAEMRSATSEYSVFFTPNSFRAMAPDRSSDQVLACRALYLDVDVDPSGKKEVRKGVFADCYDSKSSAHAAITGICDGFGLPHPTTVVDSGRGLHLYWRLDADIPAEYWEHMGRRLKQFVGSLDPRLTVDTTRGATAHDYMRLPGTVNSKGAEPTVVWYFEGALVRQDIPYADMDAALPEIAGHTVGSGHTAAAAPRSILSVDSPDESLRTPIQKMASGCAQLAKLMLDPVARNTHDGWKAMIHALAWEKDRDHAIAVALHLSDTSKGGGEKELLNYIAGEQVSKPPTCQALSFALGDMTRQGCAACPFYASSGGGGTFLRGHIEQERLANVTAHNARKQATTPAPVAVQAAAPMALVTTPAVHSTDVAADAALATLVASTLPADTAFPASCFPDAPFGSDPWIDNAVRPIKLPPTMNVAAGNLTYAPTATSPLTTRRVAKDEDGQVYLVPEPVSPQAFIWVLSTHSSTDRDVALMVKLVIARGTPANFHYRIDTFAIADIADPKLLVSRLSMCHVVIMPKQAPFLSDGLIQQIQRTPMSAAVTSYGWISSDDAAPSFSVCGALITRAGMQPAIPVGSGTDIMRKHGVTGTMQDEVQLMRTLCRSATHVSAAAYLSGMASVLMRWTAGKVVMMTLSGTSGTGKSTALKAAQSPWGLIGDGYELTGNASAQAPERIYETYRDIGLRVDEMTTKLLGVRGTEVAQQVMALSGGQARAIAGRSGGVNAARPPFAGIQLSTSNVSLTSTIASGENTNVDTTIAAMARVIELRCMVPQDVFNGDAAAVASINELADRSGGRVGLLFVQHVMLNYDAVKLRVSAAVGEVERRIGKDQYNRFSAAAGAAILVASEIINHLFPSTWDMSKDDTMDIISKLSFDANEQRNNAGTDPAQLVVDLFYALPSDNGWLMERTKGGGIQREPRPAAAGSAIKMHGGPGEPSACYVPGRVRSATDSDTVVVTATVLRDYCDKRRVSMDNIVQLAAERGILDTAVHGTSTFSVEPVLTDMSNTSTSATPSSRHRPAYHFLLKTKGRGRGSAVTDADGRTKILLKDTSK